MAAMGTLRRVAPDALQVLLAVLSGALYGGWGVEPQLAQGALAGLGWGLVLTRGWAIRRRRKDAPLSR